MSSVSYVKGRPKTKFYFLNRVKLKNGDVINVRSNAEHKINQHVCIRIKVEKKTNIIKKAIFNNIGFCK
jgi:DNA-directed RNA polymerase subunit L